ncbi:hypothetical protein ASG41_06115 [Modestobacter sp. Leaf380]|nr:hypothetical protein ASG41_06115 [Modestobacter sp. Leaf380]
MQVDAVRGIVTGLVVFVVVFVLAVVMSVGPVGTGIAAAAALTAGLMTARASRGTGRVDGPDPD